MDFLKQVAFQATMDEKPVEPLRIIDNDLWALTISLSDVSHKGLHCIVSHDLLCRLIGMSPLEAMVWIFAFVLCGSIRIPLL